MQFLGSVRLDSSKRVTLVKEVAEILKVGPQDFLAFYIKDGEVVIRRVLRNDDEIGFNNAEFYEWARKRQIEIDMEDDDDRQSQMQLELDESIEHMREMEARVRGEIGEDD